MKFSDKFNLCNTCLKRKQDKCSMYRKNPDAKVVDCGNFEPDPALTSLTKAFAEVMKEKSK